MAHHIVVLGGGYGGLMTAIRLAGKNKQVQITLINGQENFVERIRLHEVATKIDFPVRTIPSLLQGTGVKFLQGWVSKLEPHKRCVHVNNQIIQYDTLIFALGSSVSQNQIAGVAENAYFLNPYGQRDAQELAEALQKLPSQAKVLVIGGGATGIEGATQIKSVYPHLQVDLITQGEFGTFKNQQVQTHLRRAMELCGVAVYEHQEVKNLLANEAVLESGEHLAFDICLWAGGFTASPLAREAGLKVNERGQIRTDPYLRSLDDANIYAVGDAIAPLQSVGAPMRMSVLVAMITGAYVADILNRQFRGKIPKPFAYSTYGQGIAVGKSDAIGFMTYPDDQAVGIILRGRWGAWMRGFFIWFLAYSLQIERRIPGFFFYLGKNRAAKPEQTQLNPTVLTQS